MAYNSIADVRDSWGSSWADASDEEVLSAYSKAAKLDMSTAANMLSYAPGKGSLTGERVSGAVDNYQSGWYGLGEAVAGSLGATGVQDWMRSGRQDNEVASDVAASRARALGGIDSYKDVHGVGDAANWLGGLGAQALPYAAEAVTGGLVARGLSTGLRGAVNLGRAAEAAPEAVAAGNAARKALNTRASIGGAAASYPSSVGDILGNQRSQLSDNGLDDNQVDLGSALAGGVPYAALNLLSPENRLLTTGRIGRSFGALDNVGGIKGTAARLGANAGTAALVEGGNEFGQEMINQRFGRMAVDPNETMFNDKSVDRFKESFAGGAALGGVFGGAAGGWRRSNGYQPPAAPVEEQPNLLERPSVQLEGGLDSYGPADGPQFAPPTDAYAGEDLASLSMQRDNLLDELDATTDPEYATLLRGELTRIDNAMRTPEPDRGDGRGQLGLMSGVYSNVAGESPIELTTDEVRSGRSPKVLAGMQPDLFGAPDVRGTGNTQMLPGEQAQSPDSSTGDLFDQNPSATAQTMFSPATEPSSVQQNSGLKGLGAVVANIRSQIAQRVNRDGDMALATALAVDMAKVTGDVGAVNGVIQKALDSNAKAMDKLEKQVSGGSDMLTPEEYGAARFKLESKLLTIYAAQELAQEHQRANTNALAQEGAARAQPGTTVGTAPGTEQSAALAQDNSREQIIGDKIANTDIAVQEGQAKQSAEQRSQILGDILADEDTANVWKRFTAELRRQGFNNVAPSPDEIKTITAFHNMMKAQQANAPATPVAPVQSETDWRAERDAVIGETPAAAVSGRTETPKSTGLGDSGKPADNAGSRASMESGSLKKVATPFKTAANQLKGEKVTSLVDRRQDQIEDKDDAQDAAEFAEDLKNVRQRTRNEYERRTKALWPVIERAKKAVRDTAYPNSLEAGSVEFNIRQLEGVAEQYDKLMEGDDFNSTLRRLDDAMKELPAATQRLQEAIDALNASPKPKKPLTAPETQPAAPVKKTITRVKSAKSKEMDLEDDPAPAPEKIKAVKPIKRSDYNAEDIAADIDYINHKDAEAEETKSEGKFLNALHDIINMTDRAVHPKVKAHGDKVLESYQPSDVAKVRAIIKSSASLTNPAYTAGFSVKQSPSPVSGGYAADVVVAAINNKLAGSGNSVTLVETFAYLPQTIQDAAEDPKGLRGLAFGRGQVFVIQDQIQSAQELEEVIAHELYGHVGLRSLFGPDIYSRLNKLAMSMGPAKIAELVKKYKLDQNGYIQYANKLTANDKMTRRAGGAEELRRAWLMEELLAHIAEKETGRLKQLALEVVGAVRAWLRDHGFMKLAELGMTDIAHVLKQARGAAVTGMGTVDVPMFSKTATTVTQGKPDFGRMPQEKIESFNKTPFGYLVRDILGGWRNFPQVLGALALNQIQDRFPQLKHVDEAINRMLGMGNRVTQLMRVPDTVMKQWASLTRSNKVMAQRLNALLPNASMADMWIDGQMHPQDDPRNKHLDFKDREVMAQANDLRKEWTALPPAFQKLYQAVTKSLTDQRATNNEAMLKRIVSNHAEALTELATPEALLEMAKLGKLDRAMVSKGLKPGTNPKLYRELQELVDDINTGYMRPAEVAGPYFPLMREGENVVVFKAADYRAIEARLEKAKAAFDAVYAEQADGTDVADFDAALKPVRAELTAARAALADAKKNGNLYSVEFYKRASQAEDRVKELGEDKAYRTIKKDFEQNVDGIPAGFLTRMVAQLSRDMPKSDVVAAEAALKHLILQALPERSALRAGMKRAYVHGVDPTLAMQSFAKVSNRNAWTASRLENAAPLTEAIANTRLSENLDERLVGNELAKRYSKSMTYHETSPLIDAMVNVSYVTHLGFSMGYYLQNMTQPWLVTLPVMAGRFGYRQTAKAIADATADTVKMFKTTVKKDGLSMDMQLDYSALSEDEQVLLARMTDEGRIDITIRADMGVGQTTATHPMLNLVHSAANLSSWPAQQVEVVNRVATALAAYRLSVSRDSSVEAAKAYAEKMVSQTQVDYTTENAARFMDPNALGGFGRAIWQFKRYQQAMVFLWAKALQDSLRHGKLADNEAARSLVYLTASNFAVAGASGLPISAVIGLGMSVFSKMFDDEDDRKDYAMIVRKAVADAIGERGADIVTKGLPAGAGFDLSVKLGQGGILKPIFRWDEAKTGKDAVGQIASLGLGASGGMLASWFDLALLAKDNPTKAIAGALPVGFRNLLVAAERTQVGLTSRMGEGVLGANEFGTAETILKGLGLGETTQVSNMYDKRSALMDNTNSRDDVRNRLLKEAAHARGSNKMAEIQSDINAFNQRHPDTRIQAKHIQAAWKSRQANKTESIDGVRVRKQDRALAERYGISK